MFRSLVVFLSLAAVAAAADLGREIAEKHARRSDGRARELRSLYAEGRTLIKGEVVEFKMWAERPNRLRIESTSPVRKVVQVYDGRHEPAIYHSDLRGGQALLMSAGERRDFIANADFDGPLMDYAAKGFTVDYAGSDPIAGRPADKLLVMSPRDDVLFLWVDEETGEIVKRSVFRTTQERRFTVDTFFSDFRLVAGTRQPHRVETKVGDTTLYLMIIVRMEGNSPEVTAKQFEVPANWPLLPIEFKSGAAQAGAERP
jgi:outer membrane lipoprotein-sorting protein